MLEIFEPVTICDQFTTTCHYVLFLCHYIFTSGVVAHLHTQLLDGSAHREAEAYTMIYAGWQLVTLAFTKKM